MAKKKKKLAPRPKPNPRAKPVDTSMGDNEFIADLLKSPFMKNNPLAKLGLDIEYRYPQDIERMLIKDKTYVNVNPITNRAFAKKLDKIKKVPKGTTSKLDAQINTIIHELMHRGFLKVPALKDVSGRQQHRYIKEKEKVAYSPRYENNILREIYEEELKKDPNISKYIKTHMPELYFKKSQGYLDKEATKPISTMTRLFRYLMK